MRETECNVRSARRVSQLQRDIEPTAEVAWRASFNATKELGEVGRLVKAKLPRDGGNRHLRMYEQALGFQRKARGNEGLCADASHRTADASESLLRTSYGMCIARNVMPLMHLRVQKPFEKAKALRRVGRCSSGRLLLGVKDVQPHHESCQFTLEQPVQQRLPGFKRALLLEPRERVGQEPTRRPIEAQMARKRIDQFRHLKAFLALRSLQQFGSEQQKICVPTASRAEAVNLSGPDGQ